MSAEVAYLSQDYWTNSLAIGHPLALQSEASSENKLGDGPELDDISVRHFAIYERETQLSNNLIFNFRSCNGIPWIWVGVFNM